MEQEPSGTKLILMMSAGELFADHGLEGTSVRTIAEKADVNIAAINYHFGSKENLYSEVLQHVADRLRDTFVQELVDEEARLDTREKIAASIAELIRLRFDRYFSAELPGWYSKLLIRSLLEPSPALQVIAKRIFRPDLAALRKIVLLAQPSMSVREADMMAFSLTGQIAFYSFAQLPIMMILRKECYDASFLEAAARHVTRVMLGALGLPLLDDPLPSLEDSETTADEAGAENDTAEDTGPESGATTSDGDDDEAE
ncbi:MAG: CerR family C-terminal domain-containing protein [bacterium]|nr:CerR family C-terminal domain-containing protein [bacterium]